MIGSLPSGTAQNNGTLIMPNPTLVANFPAWLQQCMAGAASPANRGNHNTPCLGSEWVADLPGESMGNVLLAPNPKYPNCNNSKGSGNGIDEPGVYGMSSRHPGGANVLMADGSVRFLKDSTNQYTVWALGSRAQGEVIDASSY
jgi:prepilin-type processing-associated H-X9-DG protein